MIAASCWRDTPSLAAAQGRHLSYDGRFGDHTDAHAGGAKLQMALAPGRRFIS
jgi:hypothetical protein